jgi:hypothetical protein
VTRTASFVALLVLSAASALAQTPTQPPSHPATQLPSDPAPQRPSDPATQRPSDGVSVLTRFAFHFGGEHLSHDDPRYVWDANYGGEVDLVDYVSGRTTFYANYQVILGDELRAFDPNQGNYTLGARVSARLPGVEAALVFHHESRHLSDRVKQDPVDWNMIGARAATELQWKQAFFEGHIDARGVVQHSFVDYRWEVDSGLRARYPAGSRLAMVAEGQLRVLGVDGSGSRGTQTGARAEGGVRLEGRGAAVELFAAVERRIDPYPLELSTVRWFSAGFRLANR